MPTYEYRCNDCDHEFEQFQNITADPLKTCPVCQGTVQRLISAGNGLIFKGSGFYITDYKNSNESSGTKPKKKDTKAKKEDSKSTDKSAEKSSESK